MRVTRTRANAVTLVATSQEISALIAGARMAMAVMAADRDAPAGARALGELLGRVLADYDAAAGRATGGGAPPGSPRTPAP